MRLLKYLHLIFVFIFLFKLVDTTVELANKVGAAEIISRIVDDLKDEAEQYRKMVMETIEKIMGNLGAADIDHKLEEQLIDGILYAFQEQTTEVSWRNITDKFSFKCLYAEWINSHFSPSAGLCDAKWFWYGCECPWETCETLPAPDMRYSTMASQQ